MCNNYPNCNCPSCTPCQDCTQVTPTCNCTTTCTCSTEQFTEECPSGLQSTNCLIYTGDNLQNCAGDDYLFRGTNFNTFLSQLWETVKCAAAPSTNTIDYDGANIRNCDNTATIVSSGSSLTTALNNIWNAVKCWYTDLTTLLGNLNSLNNLPGVITQATTFVGAINDRQPIWKKGNQITVGSGQTVPFNNLETAIEELKKYHFETGEITLNLTNGTHTLTKNLIIDQSLPMLSIKSLSGNKSDVTLNLNGFIFVTRELGTSAIHNLTVVNPVNNNYFLVNAAGSFNVYNTDVNTSNFDHTVFTIGGINARFYYENLTINTTLDNTKVKRALFGANSSSIVGNNLIVNNYSTVLICSSNSQAELNGVQFTNIYNSAFVAQNNSRVMVSGNNDFDVSDLPTGFENTVNYGDVGYSVFVSLFNSSLAIYGINVRNLGALSNTQRIDNSGNVLDWTASIGLLSNSNALIAANLCNFNNFTRGINVERNGMCRIGVSKFINLNYYIYGYVGQVSHSWGLKQGGTVAMSNIISKNPALTNSTNVGILDTPFSYNNGFIAFTGWSNSAPVII